MNCHPILDDHYCWERLLLNVLSHQSSQFVSLLGLKTKAMSYKPLLWELDFLSWRSHHINIRNCFLNGPSRSLNYSTTSLLFSDGCKSHDAATLALVFHIELILFVFVSLYVAICGLSFTFCAGFFCTFRTQTEQMNLCSALCCMTLIFHSTANDCAASSVGRR